MTQENKYAWVKPGLWGAALGAVALAVVGFTWGDWATAGGAEKMATARADTAVVALLAPLCAAQASADPAGPAKMAEFTAATSYERAKFITEAKWAEIPGIALSTGIQSKLVNACRDELLKIKPA